MPLLPIPSTPALLLPTRFISPKPLSSLFGHTTRPVGVDVALLVTLLFAFALPCPVFCIAPPSLLHCFHEHIPSLFPVLFVFLFVRVFARHPVKAHTRHCRSLTYLHRLFLLAQPSSAQPSLLSLTAQILTASFVFTLTAVTSLSPLLG
ncbi:hypothetical protein HDV62DRAFT_130179 [Trichoderma sp. SZMC 28011]